jgi:hypothetical protein
MIVRRRCFPFRRQFHVSTRTRTITPAGTPWAAVTSTIPSDGAAASAGAEQAIALTSPLVTGAGAVDAPPQLTRFARIGTSTSGGDGSPSGTFWHYKQLVN